GLCQSNLVPTVPTTSLALTSHWLMTQDFAAYVLGQLGPQIPLIPSPPHMHTIPSSTANYALSKAASSKDYLTLHKKAHERGRCWPRLDGFSLLPLLYTTGWHPGAIPQTIIAI